MMSLTRVHGLVRAGLYRLAAAAAVFAALALPVAAAPISLQTDQSAVSLNAGDSLVISGRITNVSGASLQTTELFLSITGYPFDALEVTPMLGDPDLSLADRTVSPLLDLFEIAALPGLVATQVFSLSVVLEDIFGNFADAVSVQVTVLAGPATVPEPCTLALALLALLPLVVRRGAGPGLVRLAPR